MKKILYTTNFGSGWVTANSHLPIEAQSFMVKYLPIIEFIESGKEIAKTTLGKDEDGNYVEVINSPIVQQLVNEMQEKWPNIEVNTGGACNLGVVEVPSGCVVKITQYDGKESLEYSCDNWL